MKDSLRGVGVRCCAGIHTTFGGWAVSDPFTGLPRGHYGAIYADPPWPFATWSHKGQGRSGEAHYQTMGHDDIAAMSVAELAAPDCALFFWVVQTQLPQAVRIVEAWGFTLKSIAFVWIKGHALPLFPEDVVTQMGMGKWTRAECEQCWLATRGAPKRLNADVRQVIDERRREHSRKPGNAYDRIERLVAGPYLELFARTTRPGWDSWGNEVGKFSPQPSFVSDRTAPNTDPHPEYDPEADSIGSYNTAIEAIRDDVKLRGKPIPECLLSQSNKK